MNPAQILSSLKEALGEAVRDGRTAERRVGLSRPRPVYDVWLSVDRARLHDAVAHLCASCSPHLSVISGEDTGGDVALNYHFSIGWGERFGEGTFTLRTAVPKSDLRIPTITDVLPGAQTSEREKGEFFGLEIVGAPDSRNLFLPEDAAIHPWRKDLQAETTKEVRRLVKWEALDE